MVKSFGAYKRVMMLGIDGMGAFNAMTDTPVMDKLFENGATTGSALASRPTISGQCWTSMLTGATPAVHGLSNADMHPIENLPTIFGLARKAFPDAEMAAFTDWSPIAYQIISPTGGANHLDAGADDALVDRLLTYLDDHDPKLLFIQFDSVDGAGHTYGYGAKGHLDRITHVDGLLGKIVDKYRERGFFDDTLFIVTADHGGTPFRGHGGWTQAEREVFLGVSGKTVKKGKIDTVCMRDFPAIVLWALGIKAPDFNPKGYAAQMPVGVFEDAGVTDRVDVVDPPRKFAVRPEPKKGSPEWIGNFIPEEKIRMFVNFEGGEEDVSGHCKITAERGFVKHYTEGIFGQAGEFGNGSLKVEGATHGDVFSIALWAQSSTATGWIDVFSNRDNVRRSFTVATLDEGVGLFLKEADQSQPYRLDLAGDTSEETTEFVWTHYLYVVDIPNRTVKGYSDFGNEKVMTLNEDIDAFFHMEDLHLGYEQMNDTIYRMVDDFLIVDGAVDPKALEKYYFQK